MGLIGLLLAALGIHGITAYTVTQRTREIGIRVALGAPRGEVLRLIVRQAMTMAAVGGVIGLLAAALGSRLLAGLLYGITPLDPISFAGAVGLLATLALVASLIPARRAASVGPVATLRAE